MSTLFYVVCIVAIVFTADTIQKYLKVKKREKTSDPELEETLAQIEKLEERIRAGELGELGEQRCRGLSDLEFRPLCRCGFDGVTAPAAATLEGLTALRRGRPPGFVFDTIYPDALERV